MLSIASCSFSLQLQIFLEMSLCYRKLRKSYLTNLCFLFPTGWPREEQFCQWKTLFYEEFFMDLICLYTVGGVLPHWLHSSDFLITINNILAMTAIQQQEYLTEDSTLSPTTLVSLEVQERGRKIMKKDFSCFRIFMYFIIITYYMIYMIIYPYIGERNGNPPQYSCLKNPMDERAW